MGSWGHDAFSNDTAADWAANFSESGHPSALSDLLIRREGDEFREEISLAAAQLVAWLGEYAAGVEVLPEILEESSADSLAAWVERIGTLPKRSLREEALALVRHLLDPEFMSCWFEPELREDELRRLIARLEVLPLCEARPLPTTVGVQVLSYEKQTAERLSFLEGFFTRHGVTPKLFSSDSTDMICGELPDVKEAVDFVLALETHPSSKGRTGSREFASVLDIHGVAAERLKVARKGLEPFLSR